jgi:L-serine dehydratase
VPHPYRSAAELLSRCAESGLSIPRLALENECIGQDSSTVRARLLALWAAMRACIDRGIASDGILPGSLGTRRRARGLFAKSADVGSSFLGDMQRVSAWATAVAEENAAGGRLVTAPTNGAAGVVPAVLMFYLHCCNGANEDGVVDFLLSAGAIGKLYIENASISGAEVGCQGEIGVACSMAAAGLAAALGGTAAQIEYAAEIGMEHNLGLTCDPIGGLVQVPCIERNAIASVKSIGAAQLALASDGTHLVALDRVIEVMCSTGRDMHRRYKETAEGGLAVDTVHVRTGAGAP